MQWYEHENGKLG